MRLSAKFRDIRVHPLSVLFFIAIIIIVGNLYIDSLNNDIDDLIIQVTTLRYEQTELEDEASKLSAEIQSSETNEYISSTARELYDYILPGEIRFEITNLEALFGSGGAEEKSE